MIERYFCSFTKVSEETARTKKKFHDHDIGMPVTAHAVGIEREVADRRVWDCMYSRTRHTCRVCDGRGAGATVSSLRSAARICVCAASFWNESERREELFECATSPASVCKFHVTLSSLFLSSSSSSSSSPDAAVHLFSLTQCAFKDETFAVLTDCVLTASHFCNDAIRNSSSFFSSLPADDARAVVRDESVIH